MRTEVECLVCFMRQALTTARISTPDPVAHRRVVQEIGALLPGLDFDLSPPENAVGIYARIAETTGVADPYRELKEKSRTFALAQQGRVRKLVREADDPLYVAVRFAIAANVIDYGSQHDFDARASLRACLSERFPVDDFDVLRQRLAAANRCSVLYLADNCGEIVFDALLIEELQRLGCTVQMAVRGEVILNDATMKEALDSGLDKLCRIIPNGTGCPGTPLFSCSRQLQDAFAAADLIISKGQGNFETLSEQEGPVFYLLTVKCPVVARQISTMCGLEEGELQGRGEMVLMQGGRR